MYEMQRSMSTHNFGNYSDSYDYSAYNESPYYGDLQRSFTTANCTVEKSRGFKPSDRRDPSAKQFLTDLSKKIFHLEPSAPTTHVDLQKIFTPAHDAEEILPSNRHRKKLFSSSQFYSPGLHPTVEDQVELARRISHSLSDISNKQSKGQTMYSNRKKRSDKWVHEGEGRADLQSYNGYTEEIKENEYYQRQHHQFNTPQQTQGGRLPLKLVMDPRGQVRDLESLRRQGYNIDPPMQSPEICNEVVNALHAPRGKGAELFAKRRKKADKYIIDETTAAKHSPSGVPYVQSAGSTLPAFTEAGSQRVQQSIKYDQLIHEKYNNAQSRVKLVKSPWEAALETGYVDNAFQDVKKPTPISQPSYDYNSTPSAYYQPPPAQELPQQAPRPRPASYTSSSQRDLAYKPSVPQGWRAPPAQLPRGLYTPPEIPLAGYDPPATEKFLPKPSKPSYGPSSYGSSTLPPPSIVTQPAPAQQYQPPLQQPQQQQQQSTYQNQQQQSTYQNQPQQQQQQSYQSYKTKTTQNYYSSQQQTKVGNVSPTPFGQQSQALHRPQPQQVFPPKSPLPQVVNQSVPWAKNVQRSLPQQQKFNNPSPVSYGSSPTGYGSKPQQQSPQFNNNLYAPSPAATLPKPQQQYNAPSNGYGTYPGRSPSTLSPSYVQSAPPLSPHANVDLSSCKNYNTAARGWNQSKDYYRPVHLAQKGKKTALPYTDF